MLLENIKTIKKNGCFELSQQFIHTFASTQLINNLCSLLLSCYYAEMSVIAVARAEIQSIKFLLP